MRPSNYITGPKRRNGRKASPWNRAPMCGTARALAAFKRYIDRGKTTKQRAQSPCE